MVGTFTGYDRRDRQTLTLRFSREGALRVSLRDSSAGAGRVTVRYSQDRLTINDVDYNVDETSDGFRATPVDDRGGSGSSGASRIDFRRTTDN